MSESEFDVIARLDRAVAEFERVACRYVVSFPRTVVRPIPTSGCDDA